MSDKSKKDKAVRSINVGTKSHGVSLDKRKKDKK